MKDSFIFYRSFYESAKDILSDNDRLKLYEMIFELGLNNLETTEQDKMVRGVFKLIEPQIKANNRRYENGKKGGAPTGNSNATKTTKKQPKNNLETTKKQPNNNVNENVNENVNDNEKGVIGGKTFFENKKTNELFIEFLQVRKKLKAVNSERAITMLINKLNKYDDETKRKMIEQSIVNSWKDVYELKEEKKYKSNFEKNREVIAKMKERYKNE